MVHWLKILATTLLVFTLLSVLATWGFGRFAARIRGAPSHTMPRGIDDTRLDRAINPLTGVRPGESGLTLVSSNVDAFAVRALCADAADRSLDLMYYIWDDDQTGRLLMARVIEAADRGVRVRMLLDDIGLSGNDEALRGLDSHPSIEVRIFNPTRARRNGLRRGVEMALRMFSVTRRMHNKAWIADGQLAVIGGRNIGDNYFDAAASANYRDLDLMMIGPVVDEASATFDDYWNGPVALPIEALGRGLSGFGRNRDHGAKLKRLRANLGNLARDAAAKPYIDFVRTNSGLTHLSAADLYWDGSARLVADPPGKALGDVGENRLMTAIVPLFAATRTRLEISSPYFVPGGHGTEVLTRLVAQGAEVAVLTNSLAATDVAAVHGGYAPYRVPLLQGGVGLFELRPAGTPDRLSFLGSSNASLHTKAFTVDGRFGFVGSLNLDPRSVSLNTEMGIIFENPGLIAEIRKIHAAEIAPDLSYRLFLDGGALRWQDGDLVADRDPQASLFRRIYARLVSWLPLESQL